MRGKSSELICGAATCEFATNVFSSGSQFDENLFPVKKLSSKVLNDSYLVICVFLCCPFITATESSINCTYLSCLWRDGSFEFDTKVLISVSPFDEDSVSCEKIYCPRP